MDMAIEKVDAFIGECDNCGDLFDNGQFSVFVDQNNIKEEMEECTWFVGHPSDPHHSGKHYCSKCFTYDEDEDDVIHIVESRKKQP